jgi:NAD dependent epimerase/dehydratase family enzyme
MSGPFNAVAPAPVSNREFVLEIARHKRDKWFIPVHVPSFLLKLVLGEMSIEVLKSATVSCDKLHHLGYEFAFPEIAAAIHELVKERV